MDPDDCIHFRERRVLPEIPSPQDNPRGLNQRYSVQKTDGEPVDSEAVYFVLRIDGRGSDEHHQDACRHAARMYAQSILMNSKASHLHQMAHELIAWLDKTGG